MKEEVRVVEAAHRQKAKTTTLTKTFVAAVLVLASAALVGIISAISIGLYVMVTGG